MFLFFTLEIILDIKEEDIGPIYLGPKKYEK